MRRVRLYGRRDCHLCDEAREMLHAILDGTHDAELVEVDIDADERLLRKYLERIPVIEVDDEVVSELVPEPSVLRAALLHTSAR